MYSVLAFPCVLFMLLSLFDICTKSKLALYNKRERERERERRRERETEREREREREREKGREKERELTSEKQQFRMYMRQMV